MSVLPILRKFYKSILHIKSISMEVYMRILSQILISFKKTKANKMYTNIQTMIVFFVSYIFEN